MGTVIDHTAVTRASWRSKHSALRLAVATAKTCLHEAGHPANDLDLLVNVGLYRDRNLGEPALAALIQEDVGANPEDPHPDSHGTFSFDIANGTCGPLTALQVVDGFLRAGTIRRALVVASDADPGHGLIEDFPFDGVGGALLCGWAADDSGFSCFRSAGFPDDGETFHSTVTSRDGRNRLEIVASDHLDATYAVAGAKVAFESLANASTDLASVDLVVAAPARPGFRTALAAHLNVPPERLVVAGGGERVHTAALIAAIHEANLAGRLKAGDTVLVVAVGASVTASAALYRVPGGSQG
jgi:3-oxoacyl-[acyl-carrier-protein] synthase-3